MYIEMKRLFTKVKDYEAATLTELYDLEDLARDLSHQVEDLERAWEAAEAAEAEGAISWELVDLLGTALDVAYENSDYAFDKCAELKEELAHWTTMRQNMEAALKELVSMDFLNELEEDWA